MAFDQSLALKLLSAEIQINKERYKTSRGPRCHNADNDTWGQHGAPTNSQGDIRGDTQQEKKRKKIKEKREKKRETRYG